MQQNIILIISQKNMYKEKLSLRKDWWCVYHYKGTAGSGVKNDPLIGELYGFVKEFYEIVFSKQSHKLDVWLDKLQQVDMPELQTYVNGVRHDLSAEKNSIDLPYNNGLAEGSVNKIKMIKRIMYGRNSFELLKAKVLLGEKYHYCFN